VLTNIRKGTMKEESTKRLSRDDRREQIIQAALLVFIEKGYTQTTTLEIAKAADISEVTLFRNFSSKKEIFFAGIEPILSKALQDDVPSGTGHLEPKQLEEIIFNRIKFLEDNRGIIKLILNESMMNQQDENTILRMVINLKSLLEKNMILGDDEFTVRLLMGSFLSFLYLPESNEELIKTYTKRISELILQSHK
jgi:AcrR family transcriptional regulator